MIRRVALFTAVGAIFLGCPEGTTGPASGAQATGGDSDTTQTTGGDVSITGGTQDTATTGAEDTGATGGNDTSATGDEDAGGPPTLSGELCVLTGDGADSACDSPPVDFGDVPVGTEATRRLRLTNTSSAVISLDAAELDTALYTIAVLSGGDAPSAVPLPQAIAAGEWVYVDVTLLAGPGPGALPEAHGTLSGSLGDQTAEYAFAINATIVDCALPMASCDDDWANGCETDTSTSTDHCGGCDTPCQGTCTDGVCECDPGFAGDACDQCQEGFFGADCAACPGGGTCSDHGTCDDGMTGAGACTCDDGWAGDGCDADIDECQGDTPVCDSNAGCANTDGGFECTCNAGYMGDGFACADIDECQDNTFDCPDTTECLNVDGGFECVCADGFAFGTACTKASEGAGCADLPACEAAVCATDATCCNDAWTEACATLAMAADACKTATCGNIDECAAEPGPCAAEATCTDTMGGFECACDAGFVGDGVTCADTDECADGTDACGDNSACENTPGGYDCPCIEGYQTEPLADCSVGIEGAGCAEAPGCEAAVCAQDSFCCDSTWDSTCAATALQTAECILGSACMDIDECASEDTNPCDPVAICTNLPGGVECACPDGYEGDGTTCTDIDECMTGALVCGDNEACINSPGGAECVCLSGFERLTEGFCLTAQDGAGCAESADCEAALCAADSFCCDSSWDITCAGEAADVPACVTSQLCQDIDECATPESNPCDALATCTNIPGGVECACPDGYEGDGTLCTDIDECMTGALVCGDNEDCVNAPGSAECVCLSGYALMPLAYCTDTSSGAGCAADPGCEAAVCAQDSFCCDSEWDSNCAEAAATTLECQYDQACVDIDECASPETNPCDAVATCTNLPGGVECACPDGFEGDGTTCTDIDECMTGALVCGDNADCVNAPGSAECVCVAGYESVTDGFCLTDQGGSGCAESAECETAVCAADSFCCNSTWDAACAEQAATMPACVISTSCVDIDECASPDTNPCAADALCTNTPGSADCACLTGFVGDGIVCDDIDECLDGTAVCLDNSLCVNSPGAYECPCMDGYTYQDAASFCQELQGAPGCAASSACEAAVCAGDAFCCDSSWDPTCAEEAAAELACNAPEACVDVDECALGTDNCDTNALCANTPGGFDCTCLAGFEGNGVTCANIDDCANAPCENGGLCIDGIEAFTCECPSTWVGETCQTSACGDCADGDLCTQDLCEVTGQQCPAGTDLVGGTCYSTLPAGTDQSEGEALCVAAGGHLVTINSMTENSALRDYADDACPSAGMTIITGGQEVSADVTDATVTWYGGSSDFLNWGAGYPSATQAKIIAVWVVADGTWNDGDWDSGAGCAICEVNATDVVGCTNPPVACPANAFCEPAAPTFMCTCDLGYALSATGDCVDIDECATGTATCDPTEVCTNTPGSFICACPGGTAPATVCDAAQPAPGCAASPACEAAVCGADNFCCNSEWDSICADEATTTPACQLGCQPTP